MVVKPLKERSPSFLTKRIQKNILDFETLSFKADVSIESQGERKSFKNSIRIKKDSAIWMSISPALGIEVARVIITQDSIKLLDKWNDQYYLGGFDFLNEKFDTEINFTQLQDILIANPIYFNEKDKFVSANDRSHHILTSKNKKNVRRALGMDLVYDKEVPMHLKDSLHLNVDQKRLEKLMEKEEEESLIVKRYWIHPDNYRIEQVLINDLYYNRAIELKYEDYFNVASLAFPKESTITLIENNATTKIQMDCSRVRVNKNLKFPFSIPDKFERIQ